uniref:Si:dkey-112e7.2 n=1 Tax=Amphilophus citrinellus TaxID=61819 RepID=A0A3Q0SI18_AMPCI
MAPKLELPSAALIVGLLFFSLIPPVEAYDAGDALALLLCTVLTVVGFCACLGWYIAEQTLQSAVCILLLRPVTPFLCSCI